MSNQRLWRVGFLIVLCPFLLALSNSDYRARELRIKSMSPIELDELRAKKARFEILRPEARDQVLQLHRDLENHPDQEELMRVMRAYYKWLQSVDEREAHNFRSGSIEAKVAAIQEARRREQYELFGITEETKLPRSDYEVLSHWVNKFATTNQKTIFRKLEALADKNPRVKRYVAQVNRSNVERYARWSLHMLNQADPNSMIEIISADEIDQLKSQVSSSAIGILNKAEGIEEQREIIRGWLINTIWTRDQHVSEKTLRKFYDEVLSPAEREELDKLSGDSFDRQLKQLYIRHQRQSPRRPKR